MEYKKLGRSGLKISELSLGSWITFGGCRDLNSVRQMIQCAVDQGVNFFDNAETYGSGLSELIMGEVLRNYRREDVIVSTKIFWGGSGPNDIGLSRKHLLEGVSNSLRRLQMDYVDLLYCHRPDPTTSIEETVLAMDKLVRSGQTLYWGTSEWSATDIREAFRIATEQGLTAPTMEQPEYNLFCRDRVEKEYASLYVDYGIGLTVWSPLEMGILSGKYNSGMPVDSRLEKYPELRSRLTEDKIARVKMLEDIAKEVKCSVAQLAIAWCLKNPHVSSVITGASTLLQLQENLEAVRIKQKLNDKLLHQIDKILISPQALLRH